LPQQFEVRLSESKSVDELRSLRDALNNENELRGHARLEQSTPHEGALGGTLEVVAVALGPGGAAAIVSHVLITWIKQRRSQVSLRIRREDGTEIELEADRVRAADPQQLRQLITDTAEALENDR